MACRHIHRTKFRANSMLHRLECIRVTGRGPSTLSFLPDDRMHFGMEVDTVALLPVLRRIEILEGGMGAEDALKGLRFLLGQLKSTDYPSNEQSIADPAIPVHVGPQQEINEKIAARFHEEKGLLPLLALLMAGGGNILKRPRIDIEDPLEIKRKSMCLQVLNKMCLYNSEIAVELAGHSEVLFYCFHLLGQEALYIHACKVIEHILMALKTTLNLTTIPHLGQLLTELDGKQLMAFCKILPVTVSDLDIWHKSSLYQQNLQKRCENFVPMRDLNQEFVLSVPDLLKKLVRDACRMPYSPRYPSMWSEIDHWMRFIDDQISDEIAMRDQAIERDSMDLGLIANRGGLLDDLVDRVEVMYVLGLLLVGKQRKQVQKQLAELGLIPKLSNLFDSLIWKRNGDRNRNRLPGHNPTCDCSPEVVTKIQFLRLVQSFCDHSDYKHLMLSRCEWDELQRIPESPAPAVLRRISVDDQGDAGVCDGETPELSSYFDDQASGSSKSGSALSSAAESDSKPKIDHKLMCSGAQGLLSKIIEVLKKEPNNSSHRFWLSRAVESYLRGGTSYRDQVFILRRGLLQHITSSLIISDSRHKENLQSSFDLLGELVKFNLDACTQMDTILSADESKLKKAMGIVSRNLVDSNMFIRAMVLASDHFTRTGGDAAEFNSRSRLMGHFRDFDKHVKFVMKLVSILQVEELTQENVSCLNTSLVILMLSAREKRLPRLLSAMKEESNQSGPVPPTGRSLLVNLRKLLLFWEEHYLHENKDCSTLDKSSLIPFSFWRLTVMTLVDKDDSKPTSILHHIKDEPSEASSSISMESN